MPTLLLRRQPAHVVEPCSRPSAQAMRERACDEYTRRWRIKTTVIIGLVLILLAAAASAAGSALFGPPAEPAAALANIGRHNQGIERPAW